MQKSNSAPKITAQNCLEGNTKDKLRSLIPSSDVIISSELAEVLRTCRVQVDSILQMKQVKPSESVFSRVVIDNLFTELKIKLDHLVQKIQGKRRKFYA